MRAFIAIETTAEIKSALAALQGDLRRAGADVNWTKPDNIHLTLKFLGEIDQGRLSELQSACAETAAAFQPFSLSVNGAGFFPNRQRPRTLWTGLAGEIEKLMEMQRRLDEKLAAMGFEREEKAFRPHLTIGRVRSNANARELVARAGVYSLPALSFDVREIVLMKSELHRAGAQYTALAKAPLNL